ncbi:MAG: single-stranded DNA-binding protein [Aerococcus sp.]|nr:single-stranded DNA-binding protein [Aerococcus sp.]
MINNVVLVGRLTRDVDLRYTQSGVPVANFSVAVERNFRDANGERQTDFINCVMWRKSAENFAKYTRKGSLVGLEGSIQTRNYENQQGNRVYVTEVLVNNFSFLESKSVTESRPQGDGNYDNAYGNANDDPFADYGNSGNSSSYNNNNGGQSYSNNNNSNDGFEYGGDDPFANNKDDGQSFDSSNDIADDDLPF